jgi:hypothetical protein
MCFYFHFGHYCICERISQGSTFVPFLFPTLETCKTPLLFSLKFYLPFKCFVGIFSRTFFQHKRSAFSSTWRRKNLLSFANAKIYFFSVSVFRTRTSRPIRNGSESPSPHSFLYIYRLNIHAGMDVFVMELRNVCSAETALIRFTK